MNETLRPPLERLFVKRGRLEITHEILKLCRTPSRKTRILYKCNLSFELLQKYIMSLLSKDLLAIDSDGLFQTTEKGKGFLTTYGNLETLTAKAR